MAFMRAKVVVQDVQRFIGGDKIRAVPVAAKSYPADGSDEDNTYAKYSPTGEFSLTIVNPALVGKITPGQKFYVDWTEAPE